MKIKIAGYRAAELRIGRNIVVDAVLTCDITYPVATGIAVNIAAAESRKAAAIAENSLPSTTERDDRFFYYRGSTKAVDSTTS